VSAQRFLSLFFRENGGNSAQRSLSLKVRFVGDSAQRSLS